MSFNYDSLRLREVLVQMRRSKSSCLALCTRVVPRHRLHSVLEDTGVRIDGAEPIQQRETRVASGTMRNESRRLRNAAWVYVHIHGLTDGTKGWVVRMDAVQAADVDSVPPEDRAECRVVPSFEAQHRLLVKERVLGCWKAVQEDRLREHLEPLPQTRLYAAQHAFHEIGAIRVSHILRGGLHKLTRVGTALPLLQVVSDLTVAILATTDDVPGLLVAFDKAQSRKIVPRLSAYELWKESHRKC